MAVAVLVVVVLLTTADRPGTAEVVLGTKGYNADPAERRNTA